MLYTTFDIEKFKGKFVNVATPRASVKHIGSVSVDVNNKFLTL